METITALFVLVVGIVPGVTLLLASRHLDQQAQVQAAAYQAARQEMEILRTLLYANRPAASQAAWTIPAGVTAEFPGQSLTGDYNVTAYGSSAQPPMQQISVRVRWHRMDASGVTSSVVLNSLIAQEPGKWSVPSQ